MKNSENILMSMTQKLYHYLVKIISETNGIELIDTLDLLINSREVEQDTEARNIIIEFKEMLYLFHKNDLEIQVLKEHPLSDAFFLFFKNFPIPFKEEHTHLTGALNSDFLWPKVQALLNGPLKKTYESKILANYKAESLDLKKSEDINEFIQVKDHDKFERYLQVLYLPQLIFINRAAYYEAAYHMATELYNKFNVGSLRLKFTLSRLTTNEKEKIPGVEQITPEDVLLGLYEGFKSFQRSHPLFQFILSPSFRKEAHYFDNVNFKTKREHFDNQVVQLLGVLEKYPELKPHLTDVDTVGQEIDHYRKEHFKEMKVGFRRLQYKGFKIRSHHGETWRTLRRGIQSIDNAFNIWHIDTLEHGLALGINPNYYFHSLYQRVLKLNSDGHRVQENSTDAFEIQDMEWNGNTETPQKLLLGRPLNPFDEVAFIKAKFHTAREIEHYQHDVLNRMIDKNVSLVTLPSSNRKLTDHIQDYKDHPFSWWEKKGVELGVGTDNYITLNTNYIKELLILLYTDPFNLKITKLLMIATGEKRRPYLSQLLWKMRKNIQG